MAPSGAKRKSSDVCFKSVVWHQRCGPFADVLRSDRRSNQTEEWGDAVNQERHKRLLATCQCGKVKFEAVGPPILTGSCYCTSCQEAGCQFEQLASAPPVLDPDSGTGLILYRKDRVQCVMGHQYLEEHRLKPDSPTRRVIAKCCNSAMFLDFTKGHWFRCSGTAFRQARLHLKCAS
jgi:hypothetical protein